MTPKAKGERSEGIVLAELLQRGYSVALPFGNNQRYDMIVDDGKKLVKAQVKTGRVRKGVIQFNPFSVAGGKAKYRRGYQGQIDVFLVYVPEIKKLYRVPIKKMCSSGYLRLEPPKNKQVKKIRWAKSFEF
jgi:PD-(D/E)XK endonuclease